MSFTVQALADQFYAYMEGRRAARTVDYYRSFLTRFIAHVGDIPVSDLRKHHLLMWGKTWHQLQAVQRLFEWAKSDMELIVHNPFKGIKLPKSAGRQRIITDGDFATILRRAAPRFRAFLLAMRETISRPQEMRLVMWESIKWEGDVRDAETALRSGTAYFLLREYKSRTLRSDPTAPRKILINARLARLLLRLLAKCPTARGPIFTNNKGKPWTSNAIRLRMSRLMKRIGFGVDERGEPIVAYTVRHTRATNASASGISDRALADLMGHTSTRTTQRYVHLSTEHLRKAMDKMNRKH